MSTLYLCGAGNPEGVRLALAINRRQRRWDDILLLDDDPGKWGRSILNVEIVGPFSVLQQVDIAGAQVANLVARTTEKRWRARQEILEHGVPPASLIDPAIDLEGVTLGTDLLAYQHAILGPEASIGDSSVVFMGAVIGHESTVGRGCVVAANSVLNARVTLEDGVYVGTNATVLPEVRVGAGATVGAGSVVVQDVAPGWTVMGVPAQAIMARDAPGVWDEGKHASSRRKPEPIQAAALRTLDPHASPVEVTIARCWAEALHGDAIGRRDNFFEVGGNSLAALRIAAALKHQFGVDVPLTAFCTHPTIAQMTELVIEQVLKIAPPSDVEAVLREVL
jgi:sugar O-acyltransferase (sialic acid O-acetyltransferase NeuD family)